MSNTEGKIRDLYRRLSRPLAAEPTGLLPVLGQVEGIKAVVFDVYGTLICSGVGDISLIEQSDRNELLRDLVAERTPVLDAELVAALSPERLI